MARPGCVIAERAACEVHQHGRAAHPYAGRVDGCRPPRPDMRNTMTPSRWIRGFIVAICCACGIATASAATITLTFDNWGTGDLYPASYTESGFIITSLYPDGGHLHNGGDSLWLHSREGSSPYQIRRTDGGSFDFLGFDYQGGDSLFVSDTGATF